MKSKNETTQVCIRLSKERHELLKLAAKTTGTSVTGMLEIAVDFHLPAIIERAEKTRQTARATLNELLKLKGCQ
jgi:uncharacterized protein (DUF1778 family)